MILTPAQRRAKLEAAKKAEAEAQALLNEVEQDDAVAVAPAKAAVPTVKPVLTSPAATRAAQAAVGAPKPILPAGSGPGGDTRKSGQPSLGQTMSAVWKRMRGVK